MAGRSQPGDRGNVDDRSAAVASHRGEDELGGEHDCPQVQVQGVLPLGWARRREARALDTAGVVDQHADPAGPLAGGVDGGEDPGRGGDVRSDERSADPGGRRRTTVFVEIGEDHMHAFCREPLGDPCADPLCAAGHQGGQPGKVHARILCPGTDNPAGRAQTETPC
jgi:hypothetical protein